VDLQPLAFPQGVIRRRPSRRGVPRTVVSAVACALMMVAVAPSPVAGARVAGDSAVGSSSNLITPVLSARRVPGLVGEHLAHRNLQSSADAVMASAPPDSCAVVTDGSRILYARNPSVPLAPASTLKLATAVIALDVLGGDHRAETRVVTAPADPGAGSLAGGNQEDGVVDGDLWLVGGGDALLATSGHAASLPGGGARVTTSLEGLADRVVAAGVRVVRGSVLGDGTRYEAASTGGDWAPTLVADGSVGTLGALRVNAGFDGWINEPGRPGRWGRPGDPAAVAAATFVTLLRQRGVEVSGGSGTGPAPQGAVAVASVTSAPLSTVVGELLAWSNNGAAESLTRELGVRTRGQGTTAAGTAAIVEGLGRRGLPVDQLVVRDGSGLSSSDRLTCGVLVGLLGQLEDSSVVLAALAVAGEAGTLSGRMTGEASGRVRAKTGTLDTVRGLAGVVEPAVDGRLNLVYLANARRGDPGLSPLVPDALATALLRYPEAPDLTQLGPRIADTVG
jgi:serine-type D-Ala-D-Ala carboxypeptidase/endopeptidase (penicillin-binding protein 4)